MASHQRRGWHGRCYLPHYEDDTVTQLITFRLADALPRELVERWVTELSRLPEGQRSARRQALVERCLDAGLGACLLRDAMAARIVEAVLLHGHGRLYRVLAWCVMPSHVHVLLVVLPGTDVARVVAAWKRFTAHRINAVLRRSGRVWQREYHDRFVRRDEHVPRTIDYIEQNPVKAGLVTGAREWPCSSARWRTAEGRLEIPGVAEVGGGPAGDVGGLLRVRDTVSPE